LAAVGARSAVSRSVPLNAPRTVVQTNPPLQVIDARMDNAATGSRNPNANVIQDSYWRRRIVSEPRPNANLETRSESSPFMIENPTSFTDKRAFQGLNRPPGDLPTPGLSSPPGSRVSSVAERPLPSNTNTPIQFSYLNSYHSQPQASVQAAVATRSSNSIPIDPLPLTRSQPSSREVAVVASQTVDPLAGQRKGPIRMPIPLENEDGRSTSGTMDTTSTTDDKNRRAQQRVVRDALTRSLGSTVSQDERSKKWGIDMSKI
jgi:hypothetical protein